MIVGFQIEAAHDTPGVCLECLRTPDCREWAEAECVGWQGHGAWLVEEKELHWSEPGDEITCAWCDKPMVWLRDEQSEEQEARDQATEWAVTEARYGR